MRSTRPRANGPASRKRRIPIGKRRPTRPGSSRSRTSASAIDVAAQGEMTERTTSRRSRRRRPSPSAMTSASLSIPAVRPRRRGDDGPRLRLADDRAVPGDARRQQHLPLDLCGDGRLSELPDPDSRSPSIHRAQKLRKDILGPLVLEQPRRHRLVHRRRRACCNSRSVSASRFFCSGCAAIRICWRRFFWSRRSSRPRLPAFQWVQLFNYQFGPINYLLGLLHLPQPTWTADPALALPCLIFVDFWQWTPFMTLLLFAGLRSLPSSVIDAARVDGSTGWQIVWRIYLPLLRPVIGIAVILRVLMAFKLFDIIYVLTDGGPGTVTENLGLLHLCPRLSLLQHGLCGRPVDPAADRRDRFWRRLLIRLTRRASAATAKE